MGTRNRSRGAVSCNNATTTSLLHEDDVDILCWLSLVRATSELRRKDPVLLVGSVNSAVPTP